MIFGLEKSKHVNLSDRKSEDCSERYNQKCNEKDMVEVYNIIRIGKPDNTESTVHQTKQGRDRTARIRHIRLSVGNMADKRKLLDTLRKAVNEQKVDVFNLFIATQISH